MEAKVPAIHSEHLALHPAQRGLASRIRARFAGLEGELQTADRRDESPRAAVFHERSSQTRTGDT